MNLIVYKYAVVLYFIHQQVNVQINKYITHVYLEKT